jgi:hypothetical protein
VVWVHLLVLVLFVSIGVVVPFCYASLHVIYDESSPTELLTTGTCQRRLKGALFFAKN